MKICKTCGENIQKHTRICPNCGSKVNNSAVKKIVFTILGIVVLVTLGILFGDRSSDKLEGFTLPIDAVSIENPQEITNESPVVKDETSIKQGKYKIGQDIPAGEYIIFQNELNYLGYLEISKDNSGNVESILSSFNIFKNRIITLNADQYLSLEDASMYEFDKSPSIKPSNGIYKNGMYKVGVHIPAGKYKVIPYSDLSYYAIYKDSSGQMDSIINNETIDNPIYINISDGQYLELQDALINLNSKI